MRAYRSCPTMPTGGLLARCEACRRGLLLPLAAPWASGGPIRRGPRQPLARALLWLALPLSLAGSPPRCSAAGVFPGRDWLTASPQSQGVSAERLEEAMQYIQTNAGGPGATEALVVRHGYLIWKGSATDVQHSSWSCSKSFAATVLGLLIEDGRCTLDTKAVEFLPMIDDHHAAYADITVRHFATMTSGYDGVGGGYADRNMDGSATWFDPAPPLFAPGAAFSYWDDAQSQFGHVLTRAAGEPLADLLRRRVAEPIDMSNWQWGTHPAADGSHVANAASGVNLSASDLARFGLLWLNQGVWNGRRLLSAEWVREATRPQVPAKLPHGGYRAETDGRGIYGYNWWVNGIKPDGNRPWSAAPPGTFMARGFNNNVCIVVPEWGLVLVRMAATGDLGSRFDAFWDAVFAKLGPGIVTGPQGTGAE